MADLQTDPDSKHLGDDMDPTAPLEQLHVMSNHYSSRSSLELPDREGMSKIYPNWQSHDPRSSSTQSLAPTPRDNEQRRTLLVVYIHGFMGNDTSFRSFPAHVHSYLKGALAKTHVVHTKIYPRYKTYKSIEVARDNFSKWLEPHESDMTDVVLVGHSMGGLLAADVVLMPGDFGHQFRHRILGTVSLDSPFLGLHPGIIVSGIASLFRPADKPPTEEDFPASPGSLPLSPTGSTPISPGQSTASGTTLLPGDSSASTPTWVSHAGAGPSDPYFNPPFVNDVQFKDRGFLQNVIHFTKKHMDENIVSAAKNHIMAHLEFGSCLADYPGLNNRYTRLRQLEDVDIWQGRDNPGYQEPTRVRFINYFTISTGRVAKPKPPSPSPDLRLEASMTSMATTTTQASQPHTLDVKSEPPTPGISIEDQSEGGRSEALQLVEAVPEEGEKDHPPAYSLESPTPVDTGATNPAETLPPADAPQHPELNLPPLPDLPAPPPEPNLDQYTDSTIRKQAEKEAKRAQKAYDQAVKARDKIQAERTKLIEKSQQKAAKEAAKQAKERAKKEKEAEKAEQKKKQEEQKLLAKQEAARVKEAEQAAKKQAAAAAAGGGEKEKKKQERKFCMLPSKRNGERDSAWVQVYMEGVDEVGAHCGLFFPGPHYEKLVGDMGAMIVGWVEEDASKRDVLELEQGMTAIEMVDLD